MRKVAIVNQQGGVGKTTTALCLSRVLACRGKKVLLIAADPLSDIAARLGLNVEDGKTLLECLLGSQTADDCISAADDCLDLIPCNPNLVGFEIEAMHREDRDLLMKRMLDGMASVYDFVIIDTPSSLGLLTVNALVATDDVVLPLRCDYFANEGMTRLLRLIDNVRDAFNPQLNLSGFVLTHVDERLRSTSRNIDELHRCYGSIMLNAQIAEGDGMMQSYERLTDELFA